MVLRTLIIFHHQIRIVQQPTLSLEPRLINNLFRHILLIHKHDPFLFAQVHALNRKLPEVFSELEHLFIAFFKTYLIMVA